MPKMIKQKMLQLACKLVRYGFTKNLYIKFVLKNYLQLLLYISQKQSYLHMLVITDTIVKGLTCSNYKVKVNMNIVYVAGG